MKTKLLIISFLIVALLGAFTLKANAQERDKCPSVVNPIGTYNEPDTVLLADETTLIYNKTVAIIKCSNEAVFNELFKSHGTLFKRFTCTWKTDRHGKYKYYVAYLSQADAEIIKTWAKHNL
jgi:hypothetical protein